MTGIEFIQARFASILLVALLLQGVTGLEIVRAQQANQQVDSTTLHRRLGNEIRVNFELDTPASEIFHVLSDTADVPLVGYLGTVKGMRLRYAIQGKAKLSEICDRIAVGLGLGWTTHSESLVFFRIATSPEGQEQANRTARFWLALPAWVKQGLQNGKVIPLDKIPAEGIKAYYDAFNSRPYNLQKGEWVGLSLCYDLDLIFSHPSRPMGDNPLVDRALARAWDKVGPPSGMVAPSKESQNAATGAAIFDPFGGVAESTGMAQQDISYSPDLSAIAGQERDGKVGPFKGRIFELGQLAQELSKQGQNVAVQKEWQESLVWLELPQNATLSQALGLIATTMQMEVRSVGALLFLRQIEESASVLPATPRLDDIAWLAKLLGGSITQSRLQRLQVPFSKAVWIESRYTMVSELSPEQRVWLKQAASGMPLRPLNWAAFYKRSITEEPDQVAVRFMPRFQFRIARYAPVRSWQITRTKGMETALGTGYRRADALKWRRPEFRSSPAVESAKADAIGASQTEKYLDVLLKATHSEREDVRLAAAWGISELDERAWATVLEPLCFDANEEVSGAALRGMVQLGYASHLPLYVERQNARVERDASYRYEVIANRKAIEKIDILLAGLQEPEPEIRAAAAIALGRLNAPEVAVKLQEVATTDPSPQVRAAAMGAIFISLPERWPRDVIKLEYWFLHPDPAVRRKITQTLYWLPVSRDSYSNAMPFVLRLLQAKLKDEDKQVRLWALRDLSKYGAEFALTELEKMFSEAPPPEQVSVATAIAGILGNDSLQNTADNFYTAKTDLVWARAREIAAEHDQGLLKPEHLLLALLELDSSNAKKILSQLNVKLAELKSHLRATLKQPGYEEKLAEERKLVGRRDEDWWRKGVVLSNPQINELTDKIQPFMEKHGYRKITTDALLFGISRMSGTVAGELLIEYGVTPAMIEKVSTEVNMDSAETFFGNAELERRGIFDEGIGSTLGLVGKISFKGVS